MKILRSLEELRGSPPRAAVAIGVFDGVHSGHRAIMERVVRHAAGSGGIPVIFTFDPHPRSVLHPEHPPRLLTGLVEKSRILESLGIEMMIVLEFTESFAALTADRFIRSRLTGPFRVEKLVVGYDFRLGRGREGNGALLSELGARFGFEVETVGPERVGGRPVKLTWIRDEIEAGRVKSASKMLCRYHSVYGTVEGGEGRGRGLGFPTANLAPEEGKKLAPSPGVYAAWAEREGAVHKSVVNIGTRPTFGRGGELRIEAHLFPFEGSLRGERIALHFVDRIRPEMRFDSPGALAERISIDLREGDAGLLEEEKEKYFFTRF